jgi:pilus assembly protein CpaE
MRCLVVIISRPDHGVWAQDLTHASQSAQPVVLIGTPREAAEKMAQRGINPSHLVIDIGARTGDVLPELDALAQQCEPGTRVVVVGDTNDIQLYREIIKRGVIDYLPMPVAPGDVLRAINSVPVATPQVAAPAPVASKKRVMVFMSAASGDGASTVALNTAYAIAQMEMGRTVLVDMDYQFGMVAKYLALQNQYGVRDLFEHPERGVDATLIQRMVVTHGKLDVITAPAELRFLPSVPADAIAGLIGTLKQNYDTIILDLPHVWLPWVATAAQQATHLVLVAQLWLKSVSHAARMMRAFRDLAIPTEQIFAVINRHGAKFKEAIEPKDFERVCANPIRYTVVNDIRTVVTSEVSASTVMELPTSELSSDITNLARGLMGLEAADAGAERRAGLFKRWS